jgi:hypothetical protein
MPIASMTCTFLIVVEAYRLASVASLCASIRGGAVLRWVTTPTIAMASAATRMNEPSGTLMTKTMTMSSSEIGASMTDVRADDDWKPRMLRRSLRAMMPTGWFRRRASKVALKTRSPKVRSSRTPAAYSSLMRVQSRISMSDARR